MGELVAERGFAAAERVRAAGWRAQALPLDVTRPESCAGLVEQVLAEHGRIDILVNNAGVMVLSKSEELAEADWRLQIDLVLDGRVFTHQAVVPARIIRH